MIPSAKTSPRQMCWSDSELRGNISNSRPVSDHLKRDSHLYVPCRNVCDRVNIESKPFLRAESKDQDGLWTAKMVRSGKHDYNLTFDPLKIKQSSALFAGQKPWSQSQMLQQAACKWLPLVYFISYCTCTQNRKTSSHVEVSVVDQGEEQHDWDQYWGWGTNLSRPLRGTGEQHKRT